MVVLPFDLFPSLPEDPGGVGSECGVEGVVGRWVWGDSAPSDRGEAGETGETEEYRSLDNERARKRDILLRHFSCRKHTKFQGFRLRHVGSG